MQITLLHTNVKLYIIFHGDATYKFSCMFFLVLNMLGYKIESVVLVFLLENFATTLGNLTYSPTLAVLNCHLSDLVYVH